MNFLFFFINTLCSAATQWMAIKCIPEVRLFNNNSINNRYRDVAHCSPIFTGGQNVQNLASFLTSPNHLILSRSHLKMQQDIQILKQISCEAMIALHLHQVWWSWVHASLRTARGKSDPPPKIQRYLALAHLIPYCIVQYASRSYVLFLSRH